MMTRLAQLQMVAVLAACGSNSAAPPTVASNHTTSDPPAPHERIASLVRGECFGWCPAYRFDVFRDGTVEYTGESYVKTKGTATWTITPADLAKIDELFTHNGFMKLAAAYTSYDVTDAPSATVSYRPRGGSEKTVEHYYGDTKAPKELSAVESGLDDIVGITKYIGTNDERQELYMNGRR